MSPLDLKWSVIDTFARRPGNSWRPVGVCFKRDVGSLSQGSGAPWIITARIDGTMLPRAIVDVTNDFPSRPLLTTAAKSPLTKREIASLVKQFGRMKEAFRRRGYYGSWHTFDLFGRFEIPVAFSKRIESMGALGQEYRRLSSLTTGRSLRLGDGAGEKTGTDDDDVRFWDRKKTRATCGGNGDCAVPNPLDWKVLNFFRERAGEGWYPLGILFVRRDRSFRKHGINWAFTTYVGANRDVVGATVSLNSSLTRPPQRPLSPGKFAATARMLDRAKGRMRRLGYIGDWEKRPNPEHGFFAASFTKRFKSRSDVEREYRRLSALSPAALIR